MPPFLIWAKRLTLLALLGAGGYAAAQIPAPRGPLPSREGPALTTATSWGYQLQNAAPERMAADLDVLVIDSQRGSEPHKTLGLAHVDRFKTRPDGRRRTVLAYLSIGEAESYRYYWWPHWRFLGPAWLGPENPDWKGNYLVRFWLPAWQRLLIGRERSLLDAGLDALGVGSLPYLDRILEAGFDGVYLDRVDAAGEWAKQRPGAASEMVALVEALSAYAKARRPGFLVVPQNAEELLLRPEYRRAIDAVAKEDLLYGIDHQAGANPPSVIAASTAALRLAKSEGKPIFVVEYLPSGQKRIDALQRLRSEGFIVTFASRELDRPPEPPPPRLAD